MPWQRPKAHLQPCFLPVPEEPPELPARPRFTEEGVAAVVSGVVVSLMLALAVLATAAFTADWMSGYCAGTWCVTCAGATAASTRSARSVRIVMVRQSSK